MAFRHTLTVRFFEIDRAGIVFFGRFFEYCHAAFEELQHAAFGDPERAFTEATYAFPLVHAEADFKAPARLGEALTIEVSLAAKGERSLSFAYRILGPAGEGDLRATCLLRHAFVDRSTFRSMAVPVEFVAAIERSIAGEG